MAKFLEELKALAMVVCGVIALYIVFGGTFQALLDALPF